MSIKTTITLVDNMSAALDKAANAGSRAMSTLQQGAAGASTAYDRLSQVLSPKDLDLVERSAAVAGVSLREARDSTLMWADGIDTLQQSAYEAIMTDEELVEKGYKVKQSMDELDESADKAGEGLEEYSDEADEAAKKSEELGGKSSKAIGDLDSILASAGIVAGLKSIADGFMEAAAAAETYETSIAQLQTIAGDGMIKELSSDILQLSNQTGAASNGLANVAYNAISAGSAVEESVGRAEVASKLATAGFTNADSALSVLSTALNSYGDKAGTAMDISDSLITVQNLGVTTVAQLASQMGKSISTASAYNVSLGNVETAYIATTKAGIATAESTTYISGMMNELGKASSDISKTLQEETGKSFGQLMNDGYSLADVLGVVYDSVNHDTEAFMNMWGSAEAGKAAAAIVNQGLDQFNENLKAVENSSGATEQAYKVMADTTEYAHNRMTNAADNFKIAVGNNLNPTLTKLYDIGAKIFIGLGNIAQKAPAVVSIIGGATVGVGALVVGITAYNLITKYATAIQTAWNLAMEASPLFWIVPVIVGVVSAVTLLSNALSDQAGEYNELTAASRQQYDELQNLTEQYEAAKESGSASAEELANMKYEVDSLTASYEANKQTVEELVQEANDLADAYRQSSEEYAKTKDGIDDEFYSAVGLANQLEKLASSTDNSAQKQAAMESIINSLNGSLEGLNLNYKELEENAGSAVDRVKAVAKAQYEQEKISASVERYKELLAQQEKAEKDIAAAKQKVSAAQDVVNEKQERLSEITNSSEGDVLDYFAYWTSGYSKAKGELDDETATLETEQSTLESINAELKEIEDSWGGVNEQASADKADEATAKLQQVQTELNNLETAYTEVYDAALKSFEGQFDLFDKAKADSEATVSSAKEALDSQLKYWETYSTNVDYLASKSHTDLGITQEEYDNLITMVSDGSEKAAGLAQNLVDNLKNGNTKAVADLASTAEKVNEAQQSAADSLAKWTTDYENKIKEFQKTVQTVVNETDMSDEAYAKAQATVQAYADGIKSKTSAVTSAMRQMISSAQSAMGAPSVPGHADGTTYGEDAYIAGEDGPELIVGRGGSTVFPASETEKIVDAVGEKYYPEAETSSSNVSISAPETKQSAPAPTEKNINITLNGGDKLSVSGGIDEDSVVTLITANLVPVLTEMLVQEIAEEGEGNYEY